MNAPREYKTGVALRRALEERLKKIAREEDFDLQRLWRQVAFDRFLARLFGQANPAWVLKGGYAMELRFQSARSTKDLDFTVRVAPPGGLDPVLDQLQEVGALDRGDFFSFRIGEASADLEGAPYGGSRYPVEAILGGRRFVKFHLDVGVGDIVMDPPEEIQARDWLAFAQIAPPTVLIIQKEQQFAEKLHAYTLPRPSAPNSRVRDLVDLVLLIRSNTLSRDKTSQAIHQTFARRGTHDVPAALASPPGDWTYGRLQPSWTACTAVRRYGRAV